MTTETNGEREALPEIDFDALIKASGLEPGARGCIHFSRGAQWYRATAGAALASRPAVPQAVRDELIERDKTIDGLVATLTVIRDMPMIEQDNLLSANMRLSARGALLYFRRPVDVLVGASAQAVSEEEAHLRPLLRLEKKLAAASPQPGAETEAVAFARLAAFGAWCVREFRAHLGDVDGGIAQDEMERLGVLIVHPVAEACGECCSCAEVGFPTDCYRLADDVREAMAALPGSYTSVAPLAIPVTPQPAEAKETK